MPETPPATRTERQPEDWAAYQAEHGLTDADRRSLQRLRAALRRLPDPAPAPDFLAQVNAKLDEPRGVWVRVKAWLFPDIEFSLWASLRPVAVGGLASMCIVGVAVYAAMQSGTLPEQNPLPPQPHILAATTPDADPAGRAPADVPPAPEVVADAAPAPAADAAPPSEVAALDVREAAGREPDAEEWVTADEIVPPTPVMSGDGTAPVALGINDSGSRSSTRPGANQPVVAPAYVLPPARASRSNGDVPDDTNRFTITTDVTADVAVERLQSLLAKTNSRIIVARNDQVLVRVPRTQIKAFLENLPELGEVTGEPERLYFDRGSPTIPVILDFRKDPSAATASTPTGAAAAASETPAPPTE